MSAPPVRLRALTPPEYPEFEERAVGLYAEQSARAGRVAPEGAREWAEGETKKVLSEGIRTPDSLFFVVEEAGGRTAGYIWCGREPRAPDRVYLYTLLILEEFRGRGIGGRALEMLDLDLHARGVRSIGLHVYAFNDDAVRLYRRHGYREVSLIMNKEL